MLFAVKYRTQKERCECLGEYMVENRATVRRTAHVFSISKSTVHKDVTIHLRQINPALFAAVKLLLEENKQMRHLRGGEATRRKYLQTNGVVKRKQD